MANLDEKRARLEAEHLRRQKRKKIVLGTLLGLVIVGVVAVVLSTRESIPGFDNKYAIGSGIEYKNKNIEMTDVKPEVSNGQVKIPLSSVKENYIVYAMYDPNREIGNSQKGLPVMAYLTPAGRLMVTVSFCEPCFSRKFHIEGSDLVCNTCSTRWALADLTGLGGGCVKYPPAELNYTVDTAADKIVISEAELKNWKARDYDASTTMGTAN